jgi:hypothetical protein
MVAEVDELQPFDAGGVEQFLSRWYGARGNSDDDFTAARSGIPRELAEWHAAVVRTGVPVVFQDYPIALEDLSSGGDGMLPFWAENQHGFYWAVSLGDTESRVFCRESGSEAWIPTGEDLGRFLLHCTIREAVIGAAKKFTVFVDEPLLSDALESFSVLDFPALASEEPETTIWSSVDALARVAVPPVGYGASNEQLWMVTVAVAENASLEKYESRLGVEPLDKMVFRSNDLPDEAPPF